MNVHNAAPTVVDGHAYRAFRSDIQALRAFAVLVVLLFHVEFFATPAGFLGVDIFFVISGFVISSQIVRETDIGSFSFAQFYIRRSRRIVPAAVLTVAATVTAGALLLPINEFRSLGISALHSLLGIANLFFWRESGYFDTSAVTKPLLHMWSLSVEEQFYLAWPLLLVLVAARTRRAKLSLVLLLGVASLIAAEIVVRKSISTAFYLPVFRVFQFAVGAVLVFIPRTSQSSIGYATGLAAMVAAVCCLDGATLMPGLYSLIPALGAAAAIRFGGSALASRVARRPVVWLGNISYSLYLAHWPLIVFYRLNYDIEHLRPMDQAILVAGSILAGWLLHIAVEKPLREPGLWRRYHSGPIVAGLAAFAASLYLAASVWATNGWDWRIPPDIRRTVVDAPNQRTLRASKVSELNRNPWPVKGSANVLVIGDSHAQDIQMALEVVGAAHTHNLGVAYKCQPIFGPRPIEQGPPVWVVSSKEQSDECEESFAVMLESPLLQQAATVILAARWKPWAIDKVDETVRAIQSRITVPLIVVGPTVEYRLDVPAILLNFGKADGVEHYAARFANPERRFLNKRLRVKIAALGVPYLDRFEVFCNGATCPIIDPESKGLISFDYGHMTPLAGARYLGRRIAERAPDISAIISAH